MVPSLLRMSLCFSTRIRRPLAHLPLRRLLTIGQTPHSLDGWRHGCLLDGVGGARLLDPWDAAAVRTAMKTGAGAWVHLDFRSPHAPEFLTRCYPRKRGKWISNMMTESPRKTQPRCEVSPGWNGLLLTLRVAERPEDEPEPFRRACIAMHCAFGTPRPISMLRFRQAVAWAWCAGDGMCRAGATRTWAAVPAAAGIS